MPATKHTTGLDADGPHLVRTPWWRWNLLTLAGGLFVIAWTRELDRLPSQAGLQMVGVFAAVWYTGPCFAVRRPPWPLATPLSKLTTPFTMPRRLYVRALACRVTAGLLLVLGVLSLLTVVSQWAVTVVQAGMTFMSTQSWLFLASELLPSASYLAAAIGLWTLAGVCRTVDQLQAELNRESR